MTVLRFTRGDALRCRFGASPLWETMSAVRVLNGCRHRPLSRDWVEARREAASRLDLRGLKALQPRVGFTPDFLTPPPKSLPREVRDRDRPSAEYAARPRAHRADPVPRRARQPGSAGD